MKWLEPKVKTD